jgi:MoxR-like ATPase
MNLKTELEALMKAQVPLIHLVTYEEDRVLRTLTEIESARELGLTSWDMADGFASHRDGRQPFPKKEVTTDTLLSHVAEKMPSGHILVLKDFHHSWIAKRGLVTRKLRNMVSRLRSQNQFVIFITPPLPAEQDLPRELKDDVVVLPVPLPDQKELEQLFAEVTARLDKDRLPRADVRDKLLQSALGLTTTQAGLAFSRVWAAHHKFDEQGIDLITWQKKQVIKESGALEYWPASEGESDVGGLDLLKAWLKIREVGFKAEARKARLPYPKGVVLIGVPGSGKSLCAKMLSGLWKLPLLRLDVATLFGSLLGESEQHMRRALMLAETVSPAILWIDEVEKAFAGIGSGSLNSGAPTRVFGTFLTWMQEKRQPIFVIATANDIEGLPPEFSRKGRFDEIFFLNLPNDVERHAIFLIHLKNAGVTFPERTFRFPELVDASRAMVGAEIEAAVREAQFTAFADRNREIEMADLLAALKVIVPLSKSHETMIKRLRSWLEEGRARPASSEEKLAAGMRGGRIIET